MATQNPEFPGGIGALLAHVDQHSTYPVEAAQAGITGRVFVSFVVSKTGQITDVSVLNGLGYGCDEEAVRLVSSLPDWLPGKVNDEYVNVRYTLPVSFGVDN